MGEKKRRIGTHGPIQEAYRQMMNGVARALDETFNPDKSQPKHTGFVLLVSPFGDAQSGRINYLSNGEREDVVTAMKELVARFEGRHPEETQSGGTDLPQ
jgi:hypothetical protein